MDKESSLISWVKNRLLSIISRLQGKKETSINEEQLIVRDKVLEEDLGEKKKIAPSIGENIKQLIVRDKELEESRAAILNTLSEGISSLEEEYGQRLEGLEKSKETILNNLLGSISSLGEEYDKRLKGLEIGIEELKKEKEEKVVSGFITSEEEFEKVKGLAETAKLISNGKLEKIMKIATEDLEIEKLEENKKEISEIKLADVRDDKLKENTTVLNYAEQALREKINKMKETGLVNIPEEKKENLETMRLIMNIASLLPEKDKEVPKLDDEDIQLIDFLAQLQNSMMDMNIRILHNEDRMKDMMNIPLLYNEGVKLLKEGTFESAYKCFDKITKMNSDLKGAWLNRGFALGELGDIAGEIKCYEIALSKDENYKKALHNMKITKRKSEKIR